jgi:flavorubredoxin
MTNCAHDHAAPRRELRRLPREISPGVWWVGGCLASNAFDEPVHFHTSAYLVIGTERTLLYDTAPPSMWEEMDRDLDRLLGGRKLDYCVPSHSEIPHAGNLHRLCAKYPDMVVTGDMRDFHLYYPDYVHQMVHAQPDTTIELGGGYRFTLLDAIIEDLPSTMWGYEHRSQTLFPVDALGYGHQPQAPEFPDELVHRAGECALFSSELRNPPEMKYATHLMSASLFWSKYVHVEPFFKKLAALMEKYPTKLIAPAHGAVIDDLAVIMPVMREAHQRAFVG